MRPYEHSTDEDYATARYTKRPSLQQHSASLDEQFLRACGVRPPDARDDLKVLDR